MTTSIFRLLQAVFFAVFVALPASAQAPLAQFSGLYWGATIGWGETTFSGKLGGDFPQDAFTYGGPSAGLVAGVGWVRGNALWSIEADLSRTVWQDTLTSGDGTRRITTDLEWLATLRGRYGRMATENWLVYGTAGFVYADASWTATTVGVDSRKIGIDTPGWVVGLGAERVLGSNWNGRVEALYYDFNNRADTSALVSSSAPGDFARVDDAWTLRFAVIRSY